MSDDAGAGSAQARRTLQRLADWAAAALVMAVLVALLALAVGAGWRMWGAVAVFAVLAAVLAGALLVASCLHRPGCPGCGLRDGGGDRTAET